MIDESDKIWSHLRELNESYLPDIPDRCVNSTSNPRNFKVRDSWWTGSAADMWCLDDLGQFDESQKRYFESFQQIRIRIKQREPDLYDPVRHMLVPRVLASDISEGENLINDILAIKFKSNQP